jgi:hypothetical protein
MILFYQDENKMRWFYRKIFNPKLHISLYIIQLKQTHIEGLWKWRSKAKNPARRRLATFKLVSRRTTFSRKSMSVTLTLSIYLSIYYLSMHFQSWYCFDFNFSHSCRDWGINLFLIIWIAIHHMFVWWVSS